MRVRRRASSRSSVISSAISLSDRLCFVCAAIFPPTPLEPWAPGFSPADLQRVCQSELSVVQCARCTGAAGGASTAVGETQGKKGDRRQARAGPACSILAPWRRAVNGPRSARGEPRSRQPREEVEGEAQRGDIEADRKPAVIGQGDPGPGLQEREQDTEADCP